VDNSDLAVQSKRAGDEERGMIQHVGPSSSSSVVQGRRAAEPLTVVVDQSLRGGGEEAG